MVKIRLTRTGRKNLPSYRIVAVNAREKRDSKFLDTLGYYSPLTKKIELQKEKVEYWLSVGAQPTDTVRRFLEKNEMIKKGSFKKKFQIKPGKKTKARTATEGEKK